MGRFYKTVWYLNYKSPSAKQVFSEQGADAQYVACYYAEGNDNKCNEDRQSEVYGKVVLVQLEESTHGRQIR